jgi:hypothetical protein
MKSGVKTAICFAVAKISSATFIPSNSLDCAMVLK